MGNIFRYRNRNYRNIFWTITKIKYFRMGSCWEKLLLRLDALLVDLGLPRRPDRPWEQLERYLARDKKFREGNPRLVIPVEGGPCALRDDVPLDRLRDSYEEVRNWRID